MVHSLYQSLNDLETIYADRIGIRYYDEPRAAWWRCPSGSTLQTCGGSWHFYAAAPRTPWGSEWPSWPATATTI